MSHPNHELLRRIQDRYIDNPEDEDVILVDDLDDFFLDANTDDSETEE